MDQESVKRVGHCYQKIIDFSNLYHAAYRTIRGKRKKYAAARFYYYLEPELLALQEELHQQTYQPRAYHCFTINDPKPRDICAAHIRDRVVHHAICHIIEPILDQRQIFNSYACRKGKGSHQAIQYAQALSQRYPYFLKCDIRQFFASISHPRLKTMLQRCFKDDELLYLLATIIDFPYPNQPKHRGLPLGNLTSQHFANLYLSYLDHYLKDCLRIKGYCRYMDDFLLFADDKATLHDNYYDLIHFLQSQLELKLKVKATRLAPVSEGINFLGMQIFPNHIRLNPKSLQRIRQRIKTNQQYLQTGEINTETMIQSTSAMIAHLQHVDSWHLRKSLFSTTMEL